MYQFFLLQYGSVGFSPNYPITLNIQFSPSFVSCMFFENIECSYRCDKNQSCIRSHGKNPEGPHICGSLNPISKDGKIKTNKINKKPIYIKIINKHYIIAVFISLLTIIKQKKK